jgi:hypothetical protein
MKKTIKSKTQILVDKYLGYYAGDPVRAVSALYCDKLHYENKHNDKHKANSKNKFECEKRDEALEGMRERFPDLYTIGIVEGEEGYKRIQIKIKG